MEGRVSDSYIWGKMYLGLEEWQGKGPGVGAGLVTITTMVSLNKKVTPELLFWSLFFGIFSSYKINPNQIVLWVQLLICGGHVPGDVSMSVWT